MRVISLLQPVIVVILTFDKLIIPVKNLTFPLLNCLQFPIAFLSNCFVKTAVEIALTFFEGLMRAFSAPGILQGLLVAFHLKLQIRRPLVTKAMLKVLDKPVVDELLMVIAKLVELELLRRAIFKLLT